MYADAMLNASIIDDENLSTAHRHPREQQTTNCSLKLIFRKIHENNFCMTLYPKHGDENIAHERYDSPMLNSKCRIF